jgi:hypothetical protein
MQFKVTVVLKSDLGNAMSCHIRVDVAMLSVGIHASRYELGCNLHLWHVASCVSSTSDIRKRNVSRSNFITPNSNDHEH